MWFPNMSDTNQAVQAQKKKLERRNCTIRVAKTKALIVGFPMGRLITLRCAINEGNNPENVCEYDFL